MPLIDNHEVEQDDIGMYDVIEVVLAVLLDNKLCPVEEWIATRFPVGSPPSRCSRRT